MPDLWKTNPTKFLQPVCMEDFIGVIIDHIPNAFRDNIRPSCRNSFVAYLEAMVFICLILRGISLIWRGIKDSRSVRKNIPKSIEELAEWMEDDEILKPWCDTIFASNFWLISRMKGTPNDRNELIRMKITSPLVRVRILYYVKKFQNEEKEAEDMDEGTTDVGIEERDVEEVKIWLNAECGVENIMIILLNMDMMI